MKVRELIKVLEKYPDDLGVVVNGYEDGYDDILPEGIEEAALHLIHP